MILLERLKKNRVLFLYYFLLLVLFLLINSVYAQSRSRDRSSRYNNGTNNDVKKEVSSKYQEIKSKADKIATFFKPSSADNFKSLVEGLEYFDSKNISLKDIENMLDNPEEEKVGYVMPRNELKEKFVPGIRNALNKGNENDYSLIPLDNQLKKVTEYTTKAKSGGQYANENAAKVKAFYDAMVMLKSFTNNHSAIESYYKKANYFNNSVKEALTAKYDQYRAGAYHKSHGASLAIVNQHGITPQNISETNTTDKIIIDGKTPVNLYLFFDLPAKQYAIKDISFLNLVPKGKGGWDDTYFYDASHGINWTDKEKEKAYIKVPFIPSPDFKDFKYYLCVLYSGNVYENLADKLIPGVPEEMTFYALGGKIAKNVTIEATEEGIAYLHSLVAKMAEFNAESIRLPKPGMSDEALQKKIATNYKNSNPKVKEVVRVVIVSKSWTVTKNNVGVPLNKSVGAQLAYKNEKGECIKMRVGVFKDYEGGGQYSNTIKVVEQVGKGVLMNCSNVFK